MANFKDYMKKTQSENAQSKKIVENATQDQKAQAKDVYDKYKGKSEGELMREIETMISTQKKKGGFSDREIAAFVNQIAPMLGENERRKMMNIISKMK